LSAVVAIALWAQALLIARNRSHSPHLQYCVGFGISWWRQAVLEQGKKWEQGGIFGNPSATQALKNSLPCLSEQYCPHLSTVRKAIALPPTLICKGGAGVVTVIIGL